MQYELSPADLALVLALHRAGTLAAAGERLGVNASTVFRMLQRLERGLGQALFERGRRGYAAMELARALAAQAEQVEAAVEAARAAAQAQPGQAAGTVRITTTDTLLHGLLAPALAALHRAQPLLQFELHTGNELASLTRRDADIALRATTRPPAHLVGRRVGPIRVALYAARRSPIKHWDQVEAGEAAWVAPDDGLPEHPSVRWRQKHFPTLRPAFRTGSVQSVAELVAAGLGVGVLPLLLAETRTDLRRLTEPLDEAETDLWLLTHPETRHLQRVHTVWSHLVQTLALA
jgi:DNA-binding transcriptional LysR family regulator